MDSKFYITLDAEESLRDKGYPAEVDTPIYSKYGDVVGVLPADRITKAEAIDWLDSKDVFIEVSGIGSGESQKWSYFVFDCKTCDNYRSEHIFLTRLEAEDAAIIKACSFLIDRS